MYDILTGTDKELQLCAKDAIQLYQRNKREDIVLDTVHKEIRPLLTQLTDWKHLTVHLLEVGQLLYGQFVNRYQGNLLPGQPHLGEFLSR